MRTRPLTLAHAEPPRSFPVLGSGRLHNIDHDSKIGTARMPGVASILTVSPPSNATASNRIRRRRAIGEPATMRVKSGRDVQPLFLTALLP